MPTSDSGTRVPSPAVEHPDILSRIDAREQEIERQLEEARRSAAATIADARLREAAVAAAHGREAESERLRVGGEILAEANRRAAEILAAGARDAAGIRSMPQDRIEQVAGKLLALILPEEPAEGRRP